MVSEHTVHCRFAACEAQFVANNLLAWLAIQHLPQDDTVISQLGGDCGNLYNKHCTSKYDLTNAHLSFRSWYNVYRKL